MRGGLTEASRVRPSMSVTAIAPSGPLMVPGEPKMVLAPVVRFSLQSSSASNVKRVDVFGQKARDSPSKVPVRPVVPRGVTSPLTLSIVAATSCAELSRTLSIIPPSASAKQALLTTCWAEDGDTANPPRARAAIKRQYKFMVSLLGLGDAWEAVSRYRMAASHCLGMLIHYDQNVNGKEQPRFLA